MKDSHNKTAEIAVKVIKRLVVDNSEDITYLITSEPVTIKILDGNGEYTCTPPTTPHPISNVRWQKMEQKLLLKD